MVASRLQKLASDIKISHSVFALPFALLATFLAEATVSSRLPGATALILIVVCMVCARTVAMALNRWADASLDALNPRTAGRAIPGGRLSRDFVLGVAVVCGLALVVSASGFWVLSNNPLPVLLSPVVLAWLAIYSFTKRFTWLCHFFLGGALALSPLAAAVAIEPAWLATVEPYLLALTVMCWVAGFDVIYALQDVSADRRTGVFSLPANLGVEAALWVSRALHVMSIMALVALLYESRLLGSPFAWGVFLVTLLLVVEHALVWGSRTRHIHAAFFTINGLISLVLGGLGILDVVMSA